MNISHLNFLGFMGGFAPPPPRVVGKKAVGANERARLVLLKKHDPGMGKAGIVPRDFSGRFLLGGVPVVAPSVHFFRAFGAAKSQSRKAPGRPITLKPKYVEVAS